MTEQKKPGWWNMRQIESAALPPSPYGEGLFETERKVPGSARVHISVYERGCIVRFRVLEDRKTRTIAVGGFGCDQYTAVALKNCLVLAIEGAARMQQIKAQEEKK